MSLYPLNADNSVIVNNLILTPPSNNGPITIDTIDRLNLGPFYSANLDSMSLVSSNYFEIGLWQYNFLLDGRGTTNGVLRLDIWAEGSDGSMIQLKSWNTAAVDNAEVDLSKQPVGLYAQLTAFDGRPVSGAQVVAYVYTNDRLVANVSLADSGVADVTTGDGIYSGYFVTDSSSSSSSSLVYSVRYEATGVNGEAVVDSQPYERPPTTGSYIEMAQPITVADQFNRFSYGPSFRLLAGSLNGDRIPPVRITDLTIVSYDSSNGKAVLSWTVPLDNYGTGEVISQFRVTQSIGSESPSEIFRGPLQSELNETVTYTIDKVPSVSTGSYVKYRVVGVDGNSNIASPSNVISISGPPADTGLSATALGLIIGFSILLLIIIVIVLFCWLCPDKARRNKRTAKRTVKRIFSTSDNKAPSSSKKTNAKKKEEDVVAEWQSPAIATTLDRQPGVILNDQMKRQSQSTMNDQPERIYFGQEDIDQMVANAAGTKSETDWSESQRGYDEMVKRAPSMDLQLAAILLKNSSNLTVDKVGLDDDPSTSESAMIRHQKGKSLEAINETAVRYSRPVRPNTKSAPYGSIRPVSQSQSETNLYYTDARLNRVKNANNQSSRSSPTNSYLSVHAEVIRAKTKSVKM